MGSRPRGKVFFSEPFGAAAVFSGSDLHAGGAVWAAEIDLIGVSITARQHCDSCYGGDD